MWARNLLFFVVCLAGAGLVANTLLRRERIAEPRALPTHGEFTATLEQLNIEFRQHWQDGGFEPVPRADDLTIARRLSLALTGTVPSLEEIRALEAAPQAARVAWWTSHLLEDR